MRANVCKFTIIKMVSQLTLMVATILLCVFCTKDSASSRNKDGKNALTIRSKKKFKVCPTLPLQTK